MRIFTDQFHFVALSVYGHVSRHGERFHDVYFFIGDGECAGFGNFSHHGDFVVCHAYIHNGVFLDIGFQFFLYHVFRLAFGEAADVQCAQDREINVPVIVYQILLQGWLAGKAFAVCRDGGGYRQVKRNGGIGITGVYRDGQQIFGHDVCIIQGCLDICHVQVLGTLQVGYLFVGAATA